MGQLSVPDGAIIYLDTSPIIYSIERHIDYWQLLKPVWEKLSLGNIHLISSELLLLECLIVPLRTNNTVLINAYEQFLSSRITLHSIRESILRLAAQLRATNNLKTPDAIHIATALNIGCTLFLIGCTVFLTNDADLRTIPGLSVVVLKDILNA